MWLPELTPDDDVVVDRAVTAVWPGLAPTTDQRSGPMTDADIEETPVGSFDL